MSQKAKGKFHETYNEYYKKVPSFNIDVKEAFMELKLYINYRDETRNIKNVKYTYNKPLADAVTSEDFLVDIPDDNIISVSDEDVLLDLTESFESISLVETLTGTDFPYVVYNSYHGEKLCMYPCIASHIDINGVEYFKGFAFV